jgi:HEAT repeat protein
MKFCITISLLLSVFTPPAHTVREPNLDPVIQAVEMKDAADFLNRLKQQQHINLVQGATWTLVHDYREYKRVEEVMNFVQKFLQALDAYAKGDPAPLSQLGGLKPFKDQLAEWLTDNEQCVRAYAAVMLGICGDRAYTKQLANLLKPRKYNANDLLEYDRGRAAMALGLVGATEYTNTLVRLLRSKNEYDRVGAAYGLGFFKAKAHAPAIARLLEDEDEAVREVAKESLEMMGARELLKKRTVKQSTPRPNN